MFVVFHYVILYPSTLLLFFTAFTYSADVGANVEARHIFLQRKEISYPHNNRSQQAFKTVWKRGHPLLNEVMFDENSQLDVTEGGALW